jgi:hypothetical protein
MCKREIPNRACRANLVVGVGRKELLETAYSELARRML